MLQCDGTGHNLIKAADQSVDGEAVVNRKGGLYLCENFEVQSSDESEQPSPVKVEEGADKGSDSEDDLPRVKLPGSSSLRNAEIVLNQLRNPPVVISSEDEESGPASQTSSPRTEAERSPTRNPEQTSTLSADAYLAESREIRAEQDRAFAESLAVDRAKEVKKQRTAELRLKIRNKWNGKIPCVPGGKEKKFSLRFADSLKIECTADSPKVLYELAFAFGNCKRHFLIYNVMPRQLIVCNGSFSGEFPTALAVEEADDAPDPIDYLSEIDAIVNPVESVDKKRVAFMFDSVDTHNGFPHTISRATLYEDGTNLYKNYLPILIGEYPFHIAFMNENAIDTGGVSRDFFSAFWEIAYVKDFDGSNTYIPTVHPHTDVSHYKCLVVYSLMALWQLAYFPTDWLFPLLLTH